MSTITVDIPDDVLDKIAKRAAELVLERLERHSAEPDLMTIPEVAMYLRCERQRIDDLLSSRRIPRVKDGRRTLVRRADVNHYLGITGL